MSRKQTIIQGTLILTLTGFLSRFMGFFYRIFLSRTFGAEGVGLYQLIFPVYALCFSLTTAGIETAISRTVACRLSFGKKTEARQFLYTGLLITVSLSCLCTILLQYYADYIAIHLLGDQRCTPLLTILSYTLPFSAIHSCICGYSYGLKQTKIPALSQLAEQTVRILTVYLLYLFFKQHSKNVSVAIAVCGLVAGEITSAFYTYHALSKETRYTNRIPLSFRFFKKCSRELLSLSLPLTANRILINFLQSVEAISIPGRLQIYHLSPSEALSVYGVLNGMALPCILFPSAITSSVSVMLMPTIAEIQTEHNKKELLSIIKKSAGACFILGMLCCLFFLLFGSFIGITLFGSRTAGQFIVTLAWICPFLYTNSAFLSIINGLGKTGTTFLINTTGLIIRIVGVFCIIPLFGIQGYLWGLLASQLVVSLLSGWSISHFVKSL